jgi:hypothetical protein
MPTARDATIAIVQREFAASAIIGNFALVVSGKVTAGDFWLARIAILVVVLLQIGIVNDLAVGPRWLALGLELAYRAANKSSCRLRL